MTIKPSFRMAALACGVALCGFSPTLAVAQITFDDVFNAPDDQTLNLAYAEQEIDAGRLLGAAAALERMLYANENWDSARLLYATVLTRLDDEAAARREFALLADRPLSVSQQALMAEYLDVLDRRASAPDGRDPTGFSGRLSIAGRYDDNAGSVFGDIVFGNDDRPDESVETAATLEYATELGQGGATAYLRGDMRIRRHEDDSTADFDVYSARAGLQGQSGRLLWGISGRADAVDISSDDYLDQIGVTGRVGVQLSDTVSVSVVGNYVDQTYKALPGNAGATDRTGDLAEGGIEADWRVARNLRVQAGAHYQDKSARSDAFAYDGFRVMGNARWQASQAVYLDGYAVYRELEYKADSLFLFPAAAREDEYLRLRGAVGLRASALGGGAAWQDGVALEVAVNHADRTTNIPGNGFDNTGGEVRLIWEF